MEPLVTVPRAINWGCPRSLGFPVHLWEALRPAGSGTGSELRQGEGWLLSWARKVSHSQPPRWAELLGEAGSVVARGLWAGEVGCVDCGAPPWGRHDPSAGSILHSRVPGTAEDRGGSRWRGPRRPRADRPHVDSSTLALRDPSLRVAVPASEGPSAQLRAPLDSGLPPGGVLPWGAPSLTSSAAEPHWRPLDSPGPQRLCRGPLPTKPHWVLIPRLPPGPRPQTGTWSLPGARPLPAAPWLPSSVLTARLTACGTRIYHTGTLLAGPKLGRKPLSPAPTRRAWCTQPTL